MNVETKSLEDVFLAVTNETPAFDSVKKKKARKQAKDEPETVEVLQDENKEVEEDKNDSNL